MGELQARESEYVVRPFEAGDLDGFLDLHSRVFHTDHDEEWFAWKYGDNPYVDHVPILLAERSGEIVGARPLFALDVSVGGRRTRALQPGDAMVHPGHRRQGLFTRMTEAAIERYRDGEPSFFFNFPNHRSAPGNLKLGWRRVAERSTYYRIQDAAALGLEQSTAWSSVASRALNPLLDGYNRLSSVRSDPVDGVTVTKHESLPAETMATLASPQAGDGIRAYRDEQFYDWRFGNPNWDYVAYLAERGGEPIAGAVVGRSVGSGVDKAQLTDVVPLPEDDAGAGLRALLHRFVRDHADSDVLIAPATLPRDAVSKVGFRSDDRPPLSTVANQTTHVVRSLTGEWTVDGVDLTDQTNWRLTFAEQDSS